MNDNKRIYLAAHAAAKELWPNESPVMEDLEALKFMAWQQLRKHTRIKDIPNLIAAEYRVIISKSQLQTCYL